MRLRRLAPLAALALLAGCEEERRPAAEVHGVPFMVYEKAQPSTEPSPAVAPPAPEVEKVPEEVGGVPVHPRFLQAPRPLEFSPAPIPPALLANGTKVFVAEDPTVPLVSVTLYLRTGVLEESAEKAGLAELTGDTLLSGGAGEWSPEALEELLEGMAATVESRIDRDMGTLSLNCRVQDLDKGLAVLKAVLEKPRFDEARVTLARDRMLEGLRRRRERPEALASEAFLKAVYGADSPWAREAAAATVGPLGRDDVAAFHKDHVLPCLCSIAVSGDVRTPDLMTRLEGAFGALPRREGNGPALPPVPEVGAARVLLVSKKLNQGTLLMGHAGLPNLLEGRPHPDRYAMQILNWILGGGGFSARLMREVRSTRGLAYAVWSAMPMENGRGQIQMGCQTRTEALGDSLACMRDVAAKLLADGVTRDEVAFAQNAVINAFVFKVSTPAARATNAAVYDYFGLPPDYLSRYVERIRTVTPEDVMRVARERVHPDRMSVVVCGDREALEPALAACGKVEVVEEEQP